ncbi:hypothetical protein ABZV65_30330 [Streptomyces bauhiniae]|uniref:hypothetical protein n=1 Tax=Streptomyces bauhiniae TaxID=2340725 RepID=UPI0033B4B3D1
MKKRAGRPARFTMIANAAIDDDRLDMTELGLHTFLVRCKDGYDIDMDTLAKRRGPGRRAMYSAMRGLVELGYVVKVKFQDAGGKWATEVVIYDTPAEMKEVEDLLEDFVQYRNIRVEPEWLNPRKKAPEAPPEDLPPAQEEDDPAPPVDNPQGSDPSRPPVDNSNSEKNRRSEPTNRNRQAGGEPQDAPACQNRQAGDRQVGDRQVDNRQAKNLETNTYTDMENRPSVRSTPEVVGEGGTDGKRKPPVEIKRTEGMRFLQDIGEYMPRLMVTGKTLQDQGRVVDALFELGWDYMVLWELVTKRLPKPKEVRTTDAAILAKRLEDCLLTPVPGPRRPQVEETPTPRQYRDGDNAVRRSQAECEGRQGSCGVWVPAEGDLCRDCARVAAVR